jgi:hypothetical protein
MLDSQTSPYDVHPPACGFNWLTHTMRLMGWGILVVRVFMAENKRGRANAFHASDQPENVHGRVSEERTDRGSRVERGSGDAVVIRTGQSRYCV